MNALRLLALALLTAGLAQALGCVTASPPARGTHYGAPGRLGDASVELGGEGAAHGFGGAFVGVRVAEGLSVELGAELDLLEAPNEGWAMGTLGLRWTFLDQRDESRAGLCMDAELGGALGVGGVGSIGVDTVFDNLAGGGYAGLGLGWWFGKAFGLYGRGRAQLTTSRWAPTTLWWSGVVGPEVAVGPVSLYLAAGAGGLHSAWVVYNSVLVNGGVALRL